MIYYQSGPLGKSVAQLGDERRDPAVEPRPPWRVDQDESGRIDGLETLSEAQQALAVDRDELDAEIGQVGCETEDLVHGDAHPALHPQLADVPAKRVVAEQRACETACPMPRAEEDGVVDERRADAEPPPAYEGDGPGAVPTVAAATAATTPCEQAVVDETRLCEDAEQQLVWQV